MTGRIPKDFIDDLLHRIDLVEVIGAYVRLKKSGKNYSARCPFHDENTPSFTVSPEKQFYYCFGCAAHGNAINFLMDYKNLSFAETIEALAQQIGCVVPYEQSGAHPTPPRPDQGLYEPLTLAKDFYQHHLQSPAGEFVRQYLHQRGLDNETIHRFELGYALRGWDSLTQLLCQKKVLTPGERAGLVIRKAPESSDFYDRFRNRVMFPIKDKRGRIVGFGGRVLGDDKPKYLNSPETEVFHKQELLYGLYEALQAKQSSHYFLVVEGYMDVIALAQSGIPNAVATLGTSTNELHLKSLFRHANTIIFCFDGDTAGLKAARRAMETSLPLMQEGREVRFLFLPQGEDPDSWVRSQGKEAFLEKTRQAQPLSEFLLSSLSQDLNLNTVDGRASLVKLARTLLEKIPANLYKHMLIQELAERARIHPDQLNQPSPLQTRPGRKSYSTLEKSHFQAPAVPQGQTLSLVDTLIRMLLLKPELSKSLSLPEEIHSLHIDNLDLLSRLHQLLITKPDASLAFLLGHWHNTPQGDTLAKLAAREFLLDQHLQSEEFQDALKQLERICVDLLLEQEMRRPTPDKIKLLQLIHRRAELEQRKPAGSFESN